MPNIFQKASTFLEKTRHETATSPVVYRRGDLAVPVDATIGRTEYEQDDGYGVITRAESRDFLIRSLDLVLDGIVTLPEPGDRIEETYCDTLATYEVLPIGANQAHWRYSDPFRQTLRIHTKLVLEEGVR